jgi:hypothetical protein
MSEMAMKFTSLAQIEANRFVSAADRLYLQEAEDFGAGVAADATMVKNRSAGGLFLRQTRTGRSKHYRIYQLDTADHIFGRPLHRVPIRRGGDGRGMQVCRRGGSDRSLGERSSRRSPERSGSNPPRPASQRVAHQWDQEAVARESRASELALVSRQAEACLDPVTDPAAASAGELAVHSACHQNDVANRGFVIASGADRLSFQTTTTSPPSSGRRRSGCSQRPPEAFSSKRRQPAARSAARCCGGGWIISQSVSQLTIE